MDQNRHMVVVSVDAMVFEDLEYARTLPNFARLLDGASMIERVKTIYPSLTHAVHATLITGAPAGVTGVINNTVFKPNAPDVDTGEWYNELGQIQCDTLFHAAKRKGLTTASCTWPLTAQGDGVIDYLVPNALNYHFKGRESDPLSVYRELGTSECVMDIVARGIEKYGYENKHPEYDEFQVYCAAEIIKRFRPDLTFVHPGDVDSKRHNSGVFGKLVHESLENTDRWLGMLMDAAEEAGITDTTDWVVLSDHGQINIARVVSPNVWLVDRGYIKLRQDGTIDTWDAYVKSAGASAHVYLSRPDDRELEKEIYTLLCDMAFEGICGFEHVYTAEEAREQYGLFGDFSFVLETDGYTGFGERLQRPVSKECETGGYRFMHGTHGHEPSKGPQPPLIVKGPSFQSGVMIPYGDVLNHAPTIAAAMGLELRDAWGKPVEEILKSEQKVMGRT
ncbi:MAG: alkaline phosphatase family protein [Clostridia bacterium]|nr:alkaline phosphatase family protein [Clostridia bacterium]